MAATRPEVVLTSNLDVGRRGRPHARGAQGGRRDWEAEGHPRLQLWKPFDGPHNSLVTIQRWECFAQWEALRDTFPQNPVLRSLVFDKI